MNIWNRKSTLLKAVGDWRERGLIDPATEQTLIADVQAQKATRSFQSILILLGVICLGFAAMTFVAANWESMSRLSRVTILITSMWASWGLSVYFHAKSRSWLAESFVLLACILFGAGIMLISQIYHIQGDPKDATWLWAVGTLIGAACTRSIPALALTVLLLTVWALFGLGLFRNPFEVEYTYPIYLLICAGLARWMNSRFAGHLILIGLGVWVLVQVFKALDDELITTYAITYYGVFALLSVTLYSEGGRRFFAGFELAIATYLILMLGAFMLVWYVISVEINSLPYDDMFRSVYLYGILTAVLCAGIAVAGRSNDNFYDLTVIPIAALLAGLVQSFGHEVAFVQEAFFLAMSIWVIRMGWRLEYRPISFLGYIGFAGVMMLIYFITVGSLIGTSAFYFSAGVLLLAGVFIVPRLMPKREPPP